MKCKVCSTPLNRGKYYCSHICANKDMNGGKKRDRKIVEKSRQSLMQRHAQSNAKYRGVHKFMRRRVNMPELCPICKIKPPMDLANISGEYKQEVSDWIYLCRKCHQELDGRMDYLKSAAVGKRGQHESFAPLIKFQNN